MSAVAGILSLSGAQTNDLVGEFQESIFVRNSRGLNVGTTLFGLMSRLKVEDADNIEFNWWERDPVSKQVYVNNSANNYTNTTTTFVVDDGTSGATNPGLLLVVGQLLFNARTGEYLRVASADPSNNSVTVTRNFPNGTAGTGVILADNDVLTLITVGKDEGALPIRASYEEPGLITNYIQTYNSTVELTNAFKGSVLRTDLDGPLTDRRIQALEKIARDIEFSYLMGVKSRAAASGFYSGTGYVYYTGGILDAIQNGGAATANNLLDGSTGQSVTLAQFNAWINSFMVVGSDAKLCFCGPKAFQAISVFANSATNGYRIMQGEQVFGMQISTIQTPFGELSLCYHPLLREATSLQSWMFAVDLAHLVQKTYEPLFLEPDVQTPGQDSYKEQYRAKLGLKLRFAAAHGIAKNISTITAS